MRLRVEKGGRGGGKREGGCERRRRSHRTPDARIDALGWRVEGLGATALGRTTLGGRVEQRSPSHPSPPASARSPTDTHLDQRKDKDGVILSQRRVESGEPHEQSREEDDQRDVKEPVGDNLGVAADEHGEQLTCEGRCGWWRMDGTPGGRGRGGWVRRTIVGWWAASTHSLCTDDAKASEDSCGDRKRDGQQDRTLAKRGATHSCRLVPATRKQQPGNLGTSSAA